MNTTPIEYLAPSDGITLLTSLTASSNKGSIISATLLLFQVNSLNLASILISILCFVLYNQRSALRAIYDAF